MKAQRPLAVINKELAALEAERQQVLDATRNEELEKVKEQVQTYGFTAGELGLAVAPVVIETRTRKQRSDKRAPDEPKVKAPPKYANPDDPEQTWAGGKGARPKWVQTLLKAGGDLDSTLIKK